MRVKINTFSIRTVDIDEKYLQYDGEVPELNYEGIRHYMGENSVLLKDGENAVTRMIAEDGTFLAEY